MTAKLLLSTLVALVAQAMKGGRPRQL